MNFGDQFTNMITPAGNVPDMRVPSVLTPNQIYSAPAFIPGGYPSFPSLSYSQSTIQRRQTARESTGPLKTWLQEHPRNPYPTKAEKVMLALISGMTLTQVSTWFANARRRLKKENGLKEDTTDESLDDKDESEESKSDHLTSIEPTVHVTPSLARERESRDVPDEPEKSEPERPKIWRIVDQIK